MDDNNDTQRRAPYLIKDLNVPVTLDEAAHEFQAWLDRYGDLLSGKRMNEAQGILKRLNAAASAQDSANG